MSFDYNHSDNDVCLYDGLSIPLYHKGPLVPQAVVLNKPREELDKLTLGNLPCILRDGAILECPSEVDAILTL